MHSDNVGLRPSDGEMTTPSKKVEKGKDKRK
jgi:hypothetical protein